MRRMLPALPKFRLLRSMVPGIISAASDNDPTTVATLAVIGSTTVYALSWLVLLVIPMLAVVQAISSQIGVVAKGSGLEDIVRRRYGAVSALVILAAMLVVNVLTFAADLEGGSAALHLLTGLPYQWWIVPLGGLSAALLIWSNYDRIQSILIYIPLAFLAYVAAAFVSHPDWHRLLVYSLVPHFERSPEYTAGAIAVLGTTLTAYAYVWQGIEIAEDRPPLRRLGLVQINATGGAIAAGIIFWFIVIATGATLGIHHRTVETAEQAASALAPLAGRFASTLFGIGLLGSALLALPVLLATSAYVVAEMFGRVGQLNAKFFQARLFYVTMLVVATIGCGVAFAGVPPIRLLFISSIAGGIATPITMVFMLLAAGDEQVMHGTPVSPWLKGAGWATTAVVSVAAGVFLISIL